LGRLYFKGEKMNELAIFNYEKNEVRTSTVKGEPWFVAKDVAEALGYKWNGTKTVGHVPEEWRGVESVSTPTGIQELIIISEPGLFFFLNRSDKPAALPMQKWVAGEVLPTIRKTGSYDLQSSKSLQQVLSDPAAMRDLLLTYTEKVISLESTVAEQAPKVEALDRISTADGMLNITNAAKTLQIHPNQKLFRYMQEHMWIYRRAGGKNYVGYQQRIQQGLLSHKVTTVQTSDGREKIIEQVLVTPKGLAKLASVFTEARA